MRERERESWVLCFRRGERESVCEVATGGGLRLHCGIAKRWFLLLQGLIIEEMELKLYSL